MNLLPELARVRVKTEYILRATFVGALVLVCTALVVLFALLPAIVVSSPHSQLQERSSFESLGEQSRKDREEIAYTQALLTEIAHVATSSPSLITIFDKVFFLQSSGVRIESISFFSDKERTLIVSGVSSGRDTLNKYRNALVDAHIFNRVSLPVDALVGGSLGPFSMTLSGGF